MPPAETPHARREGTVQLDLPVVLPEIPHERDPCVDRLLTRLGQRRGLQDAHLEERDGTTLLCLHYDPDEVTLGEVERTARDAGAGITGRYAHDDLWVRDMDGGDCAASIEHVLGRVDGVLEVSGNYAAERVRVEFDTERVDRATLVDHVEAMGYEVAQEGAEDVPWWREFVAPVGAAIALGAGFAGETLLGLDPALAVVLYAAAYVLGGFDVARHGLMAARHGRVDIDVLMVVAAMGAALVGHWAEGAFLLTLFSLGHALEHRALASARDAIGSLGEVTPTTARVRRDGTEREVPVDELERGDVVVVRPGERVPADGTVRDGRSAVDASAITGESVPEDKTPGDDVLAGSLNREGVLEVEVTKLARDSTIARVVEMVAEARTRKAPAQRFSERVEARLVPAILVLVVLLVAVPPLTLRFLPGSALAGAVGLPWDVAFLRGMAVLVAASPCALAISTPSAVLSGLARAGRRGILVKGGAHLQHLGEVEVVALDKTGTVTRGQPQVVAVDALGDAPEDEVLRLAASAEARSEHPLARAIVDAAEARGLELAPAAEASSRTGMGFQAKVEDRRVLVGTRELLEDEGLLVDEDVEAILERHRDRGATAVLVAADGAVLGAVALRDEPREDAAEVVTALHRLGIDHVVMLTGDDARTARAIADEVGIDEVHAGLLPDGKVGVVEDLMARHDGVAMVGDGVNDAPALARATVGIAMGASGTDVALETADVALMADDLGKLPEAVELGRRSAGVIRQNLATSLGVIAVLVPAALVGLAGIGPAIVLHEGSTLLVVGNALRLLGPGG